MLELGAEGSVLDIVDLPLVALFDIVDAHAAALGAEVGVVVYAEEDIEHDIAPRDGAEEAAHEDSFCRSVPAG